MASAASVSFAPFVKKGTVNAVHHADGSVELSVGTLKWKTSPRSLRLCYTETESAGVYQAKARRVLAARLEQDTAFETAGGRSQTARKGDYLLSWDGSLRDCWALDEEVFHLRYEAATGEVAAPEAAAATPEKKQEKTEEKAAVSEGGRVVAGAVSLQGKRDENEDTHVTLTEWKEHLALLGVFDGHGGDEASAYCSKKMPTMLAAEWDDSSVEKSFVTAFVALDRKYIGKNNDDGSTALVAVVDTKSHVVHVGNAGDSRALLVSEGRATELSNDHKPAVASERKRIEAASFKVTVDTIVQHGKRVKVPRVDGRLALSRAIGDDSFKDMDEEPSTWAVTSVPEVRSVPYCAGDVLVLGCDGLFDVCDNAAVAQLVAANQSAEPSALAQLLADEAMKRGSDDNVTVIVARL